MRVYRRLLHKRLCEQIFIDIRNRRDRRPVNAEGFQQSPCRRARRESNFLGALDAISRKSLCFDPPDNVR